ncbi:MAG: phosphoribosylaminoimidazolesuccinocarboxamide synthase [Candidatus Omnitrophota bacterium]
MEKREQLYEGKAKKVFRTDDPALIIQEFKDDATAFDATKRGTIPGKGVVNNRVSTMLFGVLEANGIPTHFVKQLDDRRMLAKKVMIIPIEVTIRNIVAGGMAKLLGIEEGRVLKEPVLEYHYKEDALHDPLFNEYHIKALELATDEELATIKRYSFKVNDVLRGFFDKKNLILVDFKLEFGRFGDTVILADEISPDTCRLWDKATRKKLDKDRFRRDLGDVEEAYREVLRRVSE